MLSVVFVDADAAPDGDGLAWASAYQDIQSAMDRAAAFNSDTDAGNDVNQIWIAEGTYTPTAELHSGDPRSASFALIEGVTLCGGFEGTESAFEERDWNSHETVLSGDLGIVDSLLDNAYTVGLLRGGCRRGNRTG